MAKNKNENEKTYLTPHFTLEEMTRTNVKLGYLDQQRQTQPDAQVIDNLTRVCQWLEKVREVPIIINSGYRCKELNRLVGGCPTSNHLTGCAADIRVNSKEQLLRYAVRLLDISDETGQDFDEILLERNSREYWLHFAVRPTNNRRKIHLINVI